jgi:hypothetical protein
MKENKLTQSRAEAQKEAGDENYWAGKRWFGELDDAVILGYVATLAEDDNPGPFKKFRDNPPEANEVRRTTSLRVPIISRFAPTNGVAVGVGR